MVPNQDAEVGRVDEAGLDDIVKLCHFLVREAGSGVGGVHVCKVLEGAQWAAHQATRGVADVERKLAGVVADAQQDVDELEVSGETVIDAPQAQQLQCNPHVEPRLLQVFNIVEQDHTVDTSEQPASPLSLM